MARISQSQLAKLFHRLATGYRAGLDLRTLLEKEASTGTPLFRGRTKLISDELGKGHTLTEAMVRSDYFPDLAVSVVLAGERGGRLDEAFKRLAHHYKSLVDFRNRFLNSIAWPCFELAAAIGVVALLIIALGWVAQTAGGEPFDIFGFGFGTWGNLTLVLGAVSCFLGGFAVVVFGSIKGWFGTLPMRIARQIPLVGKTIEALALSRFAWTMSVAESAGMKAVEIIQLAVRSTENYFYLCLEDELTASLQAGNGYYRSLAQTDGFPEEFLQYIDTGEMAGELAESMQRASEVLQQRAEDNLSTIGKIGFFLVFCFVAVLIGATVILLYRQYLEQLQQFV